MSEHREARPAFAKAFARFLDDRIGYGHRFTNQKELAKAAGIAESNLTRLKQGRSKEPRSAVLARISRTIGERPTYLSELWSYCNGIVDAHPDKVVTPQGVAENDAPYDHVHARRIPVFDLQCTPIVAWISGDRAGQENLEYQVTTSTDADAFYLRASGDDVAGNGIHEGDLLLVEPGTEATDGDLVACHVDGDPTCLLRKLRKTNGDTVLLPLTDSAAPIVVSDESKVCYFPITRIDRALR